MTPLQVKVTGVEVKTPCLAKWCLHFQIFLSMLLFLSQLLDNLDLKQGENEESAVSDEESQVDVALF